MHDKTEYDTHTRNIKQVLNHELVFKKDHRMTKINQNAWLKPYIDMTAKLRKKFKKKRKRF